MSNFDAQGLLQEVAMVVQDGLERRSFRWFYRPRVRVVIRHVQITRTETLRADVSVLALANEDMGTYMLSPVAVPDIGWKPGHRLVVGEGLDGGAEGLRGRWDRTVLSNIASWPIPLGIEVGHDGGMCVWHDDVGAHVCVRPTGPDVQKLQIYSGIHMTHPATFAETLRAMAQHMPINSTWALPVAPRGASAHLQIQVIKIVAAARAQMAAISPIQFPLFQALVERPGTFEVLKILDPSHGTWVVLVRLAGHSVVQPLCALRCN